MERALEQAHFSTVFVALLWGAGLPESRGPACQGHREPSPVLASSRKQHVFISQVLLGSVCRLGCTWAQGTHQLQSCVPSTLHALMTMPQAAAQVGRFPSEWNCSSPMTTAMPGDHCILATGQTWQPQCLGRREGSHGLLLDGLVLVLVSRSRSHTSSSPFG